MAPATPSAPAPADGRGSPTSPRSGARRLLPPALGAMSALVPALVFSDFTVDDALISARYATHLARGLGYRFNAQGAVTDGVTPLGFPYLLAPFAGPGPAAALAAAKVLGIATWTLAAALLAVAVDRVPGSRLRWSALLLLPCCAPLAAWSAAGMETGLVLALAALAVSLRSLGRARTGAAVGGLAAALRPELAPWALVLAAAPDPAMSTPSSEAIAASPGLGRAFFVRLALAAAPPLAVALLRAAIFGRPVPLSVLAKPSTFDLGAKYALACFLLTGPVALLAPLALRRADGFTRTLGLSIAAHFFAVAAAGGDWMPLSRLVVPVLPASALCAARLAAIADPRATAARLILALAGQIFQIVRVGPDAVHVGHDRRALIEELRAPLAGARVVASLDIGWVGAATEATILDLAGLTDPAIAVLPGGHTSKSIPPGLLDARGADTLVLLLKDGEPLVEPWSESFFARIVELRVAAIPHIADDFTVIAQSRAPHLGYVVLRRKKLSCAGGECP
ncbi:MAG: hypothetical protein U0359_14285 [Byssovorax sp.]